MGTKSRSSIEIGSGIGISIKRRCGSSIKAFLRSKQPLDEILSADWDGVSDAGVRCNPG